MARLKNERESFNKKTKTVSSRDEVLRELKRLQKRNSFRHEILDYIKSKGYSEEDLGILLEESKKHIDADKLKILPKINLLAFITFTSLAIISLVLMFTWLPYQNYRSFFAAFLSTLLFVVFTMLSFAFLKSWKPELEYINRPKSFNYLIFIVVAIIPGIIIAFVVDFNNEKALDRSLEKNGKYTIGRIVSNTNYNIRIKRARTTISKVDVKYLIGQNNEVISEQDVPSNWQPFLKYNQKVLVKYDSKVPENFVLVFDKTLIKKHTKSQMRLINLNDLKQLVKMPNYRVINFLDKIMYGFSYDKDSRSWQNYLYNIGIKRRYSGNIEYSFNDLSIKNGLYEELIADGFLNKNSYFVKNDSLTGTFNTKFVDDGILITFNLQLKH